MPVLIAKNLNSGDFFECCFHNKTCLLLQSVCFFLTVWAFHARKEGKTRRRYSQAIILSVGIPFATAVLAIEVKLIPCLLRITTFNNLHYSLR